jgi:hypothetical protein
MLVAKGKVIKASGMGGLKLDLLVNSALRTSANKFKNR